MIALFSNVFDAARGHTIDTDGLADSLT